MFFQNHPFSTVNICLLLLLLIQFLITTTTNAAILYKDRKSLNETYLGSNRFVVDNFIEPHRVALLARMLKRNRHFFQRYGNNYKLPMADVLFEGLFNGDINQNCSWGIGCVPIPDQALHVIKSSPHKYLDGELLKETENYIHIRDKIYEYASEVLNTSVTLTQYGSFFYFFPKKSKLKLEMVMNGTAYIFAPHTDCCGFKNFFQRPLLLDRSIAHNVYRKFTVVLYIDVPPSHARTGGELKFLDLPNRYKLPVLNTKRKMKDGIEHVEGGAFADPDAIFTSVTPDVGKLVVFSAYQDLHGVTGYSGDTDRYALSMFLTDEQGDYEQMRNIMPKMELDDPDSIAHQYKRESEARQKGRNNKNKNDIKKSDGE